MMWFLLWVVLMTIVGKYILPVLFLPGGLLIAPLVMTHDKPVGKLLMPIVLVVSLLYNIFITTAWVSYWVLHTRSVVLGPSVSYHWPYHLIAFVGCLGVPYYIALKEHAALNEPYTPAEIITLTVVTIGYPLIAFIPSVAFFLHGWWLRPLGLVG